MLSPRLFPPAFSRLLRSALAFLAGLVFVILNSAFLLGICSLSAFDNMADTIEGQSPFFQDNPVLQDISDRVAAIVSYAGINPLNLLTT